MRVLKWIVDRARGRSGALETPIGWVPKQADLDLSGLSGPLEDVDAAEAIEPKEWLDELKDQEEFFAKLAATMPRELVLQRELLMARLVRMT
jgi:phosphoenolpyruvate carboxykinase (GTP)